MVTVVLDETPTSAPVLSLIELRKTSSSLPYSGAGMQKKRAPPLLLVSGKPRPLGVDPLLTIVSGPDIVGCPRYSTKAATSFFGWPVGISATIRNFSGISSISDLLGLTA